MPWTAAYRSVGWETMTFVSSDYDRTGTRQLGESSVDLDRADYLLSPMRVLGVRPAGADV